MCQKTGNFINKKMPNLNHRLVAAFFMIFCMSAPAAAATCAAARYLDNGSCVACNPNSQPFYCPGDDTRHPCPTTNTDYNQFGYIFEYGTEGSWALPSATRSTHCYGNLWFRDENGNKFLAENAFNGQNYWGSIKYWYAAGTGFYLSPYAWTSSNIWYAGTKPCTNAPEHAHYTGPGTPDEPKSGGATDYNDCPWECDDGYGRHNNECVPLCAADMRHLKTSNGLQFNLYPVAYSNPALHVKRGNTICYGVLVQGSATNTININYHGQIYHMVD